MTGTTSITLNAGGLNGDGLTLTNINSGDAAVNRIPDAVGITSNGGTITYANTSGNTLTYAETLGSTALTTGQLNLVENTNMAGTTNTQTLTLSGLTHTLTTNTSAVTFAAATTGPNATTNRFVVTGAVATTAGQIIGPWATTGTTAVLQTDYAVYNASAQVVPRLPSRVSLDTMATTANAYTNGNVVPDAGGGYAYNIAGLRNTTATSTMTIPTATPEYLWVAQWCHQLVDDCGDGHGSGEHTDRRRASFCHHG